jgi:hypothetical protein
MVAASAGETVAPKDNDASAMVLYIAAAGSKLPKWS